MAGGGGRGGVTPGMHCHHEKKCTLTGLVFRVKVQITTLKKQIRWEAREEREIEPTDSREQDKREERLLTSLLSISEKEIESHNNIFDARSSATEQKRQR